MTNTSIPFYHNASEDHRGTPTSPGRVVTLIERSYWEQLTDHHDSAPQKVWGVAYRITADKVDQVKEYLDIREINGYTIHYTPFHPAAAAASVTDPTCLDPVDPHDPSVMPSSHGPIQTLVYIGTPDNAQFVGPQDPQALAEHIYRSEGPSGLNRDYLLELEKALDALSPDSGDEHVTDLSNRVRAIAAAAAREEEQEARHGQGQADNILRAHTPVNVSPELLHQHHHEAFRRAGSIDEQEETEKTF